MSLARLLFFFALFACVAPVFGQNFPDTIPFPDTVVNAATTANPHPSFTNGAASALKPTPTLSGTDMAAFSVKDDGCSATLAANASCAFTVTFKPKLEKVYSATLTVTSAAGASTTTALSGRGVAAGFATKLANGATVSIGQKVNLLIRAVDGNDKTIADSNDEVNIQTTDPAALPNTGSSVVTLVKGVGVYPITFVTPGTTSIIMTSGGVSSELDLNVTSAVGGCNSCFAAIGAGAQLVGSTPVDYQNVQNVLSKTHIGNGTPQYLVGLAYKLPVHGIGYKKLGCAPSDFLGEANDAKAAYCYPLKAFVSFRFSPSASETFSGFTYGISHAIHKRLDIMVGFAYSNFNEPSDGFKRAAKDVFTTQSAAKNPCYSQFTTAQFDDPQGYDGFPTQLLTNTAASGAAPVCTAGAQIYNGSVLLNHYHPGAFIGISVPISFSSFLGGK